MGKTLTCLNLFSDALFKSLIYKWLIYHTEKELSDFGLKIRIFDISKIEIFEKKIFLLETVHVTLEYHLLKYSNIPISG